jgi:hypothetical protein
MEANIDDLLRTIGTQTVKLDLMARYVADLEQRIRELETPPPSKMPDELLPSDPPVDPALSAF